MKEGMWIFIGIVLALLAIFFIRYKLPDILERRRIRKLWREGDDVDRGGLILTCLVRRGISRKGKRTISLH